MLIFPSLFQDTHLQTSEELRNRSIGKIFDLWLNIPRPTSLYCLQTNMQGYCVVCTCVAIWSPAVKIPARLNWQCNGVLYAKKNAISTQFLAALTSYRSLVVGWWVGQKTLGEKNPSYGIRPLILLTCVVDATETHKTHSQRPSLSHSRRPSPCFIPHYAQHSGMPRRIFRCVGQLLQRKNTSETHQLFLSLTADLRGSDHWWDWLDHWLDWLDHWLD